MYWHTYVKQWLVCSAIGVVVAGCGQSQISEQNVALQATSSTRQQSAYPIAYPVSFSSAPTPVPTPYTSLIGLSPQQVGQFAVEYTKELFGIIGQPIEVLLARPVTNTELAAMDLPQNFDINCAEPPPMMLVIMKGTFFIISLYGPATTGPPLEYPEPHYLAYIYDLNNIRPDTIVSSQNGAVFRKALNDISLPDDPTPLPQPKGPSPNIVYRNGTLSTQNISPTCPPS